MPRTRRYKLTPAMVTAHAGGPVVCLDSRAVGHTFSLFAARPDASLVERVTRAGLFGATRRADVISSDSPYLEVDTEIEPTAPEATVMRVDVRGPIEQRAGFADECGGWSDGHDAIAERMIAALAEGDVVMVIDSPGGAHAGLQEAVRRVVEAKAANGRRVYAFADEMIGSAAYWWAAAVADEIYAPESGIVGSIGARSAHASFAGANAIDGIAVTYFAAPGPGKVAFAPDLPLSDIGKERGERDVWIAFEAFASAVSAGRGLSRDEIVGLDADAVSGDAAVTARLIDGVSSLEDVFAWALANVEQQQVSADAEAAA